MFSPFYENYGADTILSNATPIYVPLVQEEVNYLVRFHYAKKDETLKAALDRLVELNQIRKGC